MRFPYPLDRKPFEIIPKSLDLASVFSEAAASLAFRSDRAQDPGGFEMAVRCGWPIKTSINNINCRATPGRNHLPRSKGTVEAGRGRRVAFNQYPRNAADG